MADEIHLRPPPAPRLRSSAPAQSRAMAGSFWGNGSNTQPPQQDASAAEPQSDTTSTSSSRPPATETLGRRAGALSDELDFPQFVASLIHGTWDAMVDSAIRQMDSFATLVAAISKPLEQFRDENVTTNQAYDWLIAQHPAHLTLQRSSDGNNALVAKSAPPAANGTSDGGDGTDGDSEQQNGEEASPDWLADYGLSGEQLSPDTIDNKLVPAARDRIARDRMHTLATLVMMGLNRIVVRDGSITARLRFRAAAADKATVDYAVSDDPSNATPTGSWATRGSVAYAAPVTKVSTVGVNAQTDTTLNAELFGEVKINFASETVPLDRFVDDARRVLLDRAMRPSSMAPAGRTNGAAAAPALPPPTQAAPPPQALPAQPVSVQPALPVSAAPAPAVRNGGPQQ